MIKHLIANVKFFIEAVQLVCSSPRNMYYFIKGIMVDRIKPIGRVHFLIKDRFGNVLEDCWHPNLVVDTGKYHIADQMSDQGEAAMSYMAIGTGTTNPAATDTTLETELDRNALTSKTQGTGAEANRVTYVGDWAAGDGTGAITEAGIFNSSSAGIMLSRSVFAVKNKSAGDSLTLTWVLTFA